MSRIKEFNREAFLRRCNDLNTKVRTKAKNDFQKDLFKLIPNSVFRKVMENIRKPRDTKLSEPKKEEAT